MSKRTDDSFRAGFAYGAETGEEPTARRIADICPEADPDAFAQGAIDGMAGDRFRLDYGIPALFA